MTTVTITNVAGYKHKVPMTSSALSVVVQPSRAQGRVQIFSNVAWLYSHQDEGSTADDWASLAAGQALTFDTGSRRFAFYAKTATGSANLHVLEVG